ncbi:MAG: glucose-6-phosphate isomerase [Chloroflexi bacterium]|nr:glucose-6-phosphate isomerase [Chloroflexota bacterium]
MKDHPFSFQVTLADEPLSAYDNRIQRRLSNMRGIFSDSAAFEALIQAEDRLMYEVYEIKRPEVAGELPNGLTVLYPGLVGEEFFMTKGHFHKVLETGEWYYGLRGEGVMVMETPEGDWAVEPLRPNGVVYVPPRWAHRTVNTRLDANLVFYWVYPGDAGHDYGTIETQGFRKLVVQRGGQPVVIDNPRWLNPEKRT